jgi:hypothetical protein
MRIVGNDIAASETQQARRLGDPFTVLVAGAANAKLVGRILVEALQDGLELERVAVLSWNSGTALKQAARVTVAKAMAYPPDLSLEEMIPDADPELIGSVVRVIDAHSFDRRDPVTGEHRRAVAQEFFELIKRITEVDDAADRRYIRSARRQIDAAIRLGINARLEEVRLVEAYRQALADGSQLPAFSFVTEVVSYFAEYKRGVGLADLADQLGAQVEPVPACTLALLEDAGAVPPLGLRALRRLLPNASFVLAGVDSEGAALRSQAIFA